MNNQRRHSKIKRRLTILLLVLSLLVSPFSGLTLSVNAEELPSYANLTIRLTDKAKNELFYAQNDNKLSDDHILDVTDVIIKADITTGGNTEEQQILTLNSEDYTLTTNIEDINKKAGKDQEITATLTYKTSQGSSTIESGKPEGSPANPKVTILESSVTTPKLTLKLKDEVKDKTFYAANEDSENDILDADDTLDAEDLEIVLIYETKTFTNEYFDKNVTDESKKYGEPTTETFETVSLVTGQKEYTLKSHTREIKAQITTNVDDIRKTVKTDQELTATLSYTEKDAAGNDKTITIESTDNTKVSVIKSSSTMKLDSIAISLKDEYTDKSKYQSRYTDTKNPDLFCFYVDNGYMKADELLADKYFKLTLIYTNGKTKTYNLDELNSNEFTVTTNIDELRKLIGAKQEVTAKLTYKDSEGKEKTVETIDKAAAKLDNTGTKKATTCEITILPPYAVGGVITVTPQNYGAVADDIYTDKGAIQDALDLAADVHKLVVNFPDGLYYIGGPIYVHSNTTLSLSANAIIRRNSSGDEGSAGSSSRDGVSHNLLNTSPYGVTDKDTLKTTGSGYTNASNIIIEGGTFDGGLVALASQASNLINIGHVSNITIKNSTFKNCYANHLIELCAVKDATITGCKFSGFKAASSDKTGDQAEAIQIDVAHKEGKTEWNGTYYTKDDTPCVNVTISGNTFTDYPVAIGNHHSLAGHHHSNVTVTNNTINGTTAQNSGIRMYGWDNSVVSGNVISNYGTGIKASASNSFMIQSNTIDKGTYGIINTDSSSGQIVGNAVSNMSNQGINVYGAGTKASLISQNIVTNGGTNGIKVNASANSDTISSNTISGCDNGMYIYSSAVVTTIKNNNISSCNKYGVYITEKASVKTLSKNTISNIKKNGIYVKNNKIKIKFKSNKLSKVGSTAIKIDSKFSKKKKQKYTFAPKVVSLNLAGGNMTTQASNLKKIKIKVGKKTYTKSTKAKNYTFYFKKYKKKAKTATVTFTDKNKNTVARVVTIN